MRGCQHQLGKFWWGKLVAFEYAVVRDERADAHPVAETRAQAAAGADVTLGALVTIDSDGEAAGAHGRPESLLQQIGVVRFQCFDEREGQDVRIDFGRRTGRIRLLGLWPLQQM